jgi:hypothetical protein
MMCAHHVWQAIDEPLEVINYNTWNVLVPEGQFLTKVCEYCIGGVNFKNGCVCNLVGFLANFMAGI